METTCSNHPSTTGPTLSHLDSSIRPRTVTLLYTFARFGRSIFQSRWSVVSPPHTTPLSQHPQPDHSLSKHKWLPCGFLVASFIPRQTLLGECCKRQWGDLLGKVASFMTGQRAAHGPLNALSCSPCLSIPPTVMRGAGRAASSQVFSYATTCIAVTSLTDGYWALLATS